MPRPVAKWNREVVCYVISFLHQPQKCPVAPPPPLPGWRINCSGTISTLKTCFFLVPASSKHNAHLSPRAAVIQHASRTDSRRRFGRASVAPSELPSHHECARSLSQPPKWASKILAFFSSHATSPGHSGAVMQAVATTTSC